MTREKINKSTIFKKDALLVRLGNPPDSFVTAVTMHCSDLSRYIERNEKRSKAARNAQRTTRNMDPSFCPNSKFNVPIRYYRIHKAYLIRA